MTSASAWDLPGGPWKRLFAGTWSGFNVSVYENKDKVLLSTVFPKAKEINWVMFRSDKVVIVPENADKLVEALKEKVHVLKKELPGRRASYLVVLSPPSVSEFGSKTVGAEVLDKIVELDKAMYEVKQTAEKLNIEIIDLKNASYRDSSGILGNPNILIKLLNITPEEKTAKREQLKKLPLGEMDNNVFDIETDIVNTFSTVESGTGVQRRHLAQLLIENCLLIPAPIPVIFDFGEESLKLGQANTYPYPYTNYGINAQNSFFELDIFDPGVEMELPKINLSEVDEEFIWFMLGVGKERSGTMIMQAYYDLKRKNSINNLEDLLIAVKKVPVSNENDKFYQARAVRVLNLARREYGDMFSSKKKFGDVLASLIKANKPAYFNLSSLGERARLVFVCYVLQLLKGLQTAEGILSAIEQRRVDHTYVGFIDLDWTGMGILQEYFMENLLSMHLGALFVSEKELPMEIESRAKYKFTPLGENKAKVNIEGKQRTFELRPLLSCPP